MSLHYLDPRRAGTGAEADLETVYDPEGNGESRPWYVMRHPGTSNIDDYSHPFETESAALAAARAAAGFSHVAEKPCGEWRHDKACECEPERLYHECDVCGWYRQHHAIVREPAR